MINKFSYICSLGTLCHCSFTLKKNNLKKESYPFDWIFTNFEIIIDCLEDNFNKFLDKKLYIEKDIKKCSHIIYDVSKTNYMFNHHNPLNNDKDYEYYVRCVNRFNDMIKSDKSKLFITMFVDIVDLNFNNINLITNFNEKLNNYTSNYKLLIINCYIDKNLLFPYHSKIITNNICVIKLFVTSLSSGTNFTNEIDNLYLDKLIEEFEF